MADQALRQRRDVLRVEAQTAMAALVAFNQQQAGAGQAGLPLPQGPPLHPPLPPGAPQAAGPPQVSAPPPPPPLGPGAGVQTHMVRGVGMLRQQRPLVHRAEAPTAAAVVVENQIPHVRSRSSSSSPDPECRDQFQQPREHRDRSRTRTSTSPPT
jgi:hypothetical protein